MVNDGLSRVQAGREIVCVCVCVCVCVGKPTLVHGEQANGWEVKRDKEFKSNTQGRMHRAKATD